MKVLFHTKPSPTVPHLQKLAECLGIIGESIDVGNAGSLGSIVSEITSQKEPAIVLDVESLKNICNQEELAELAMHLGRCDVAVLLLVSKPGESTDRFLKALTNDTVGGIVSAGCASHISFPGNSGNFSKELASHSFSREPGETLGLNISSTEKAEIIMILGESPAFVRVNVGKASIFVWVADEVFDVFKPLAAEMEFEQAADKYIPAIIFLRFAFGEQCWHNPSPGAGIVIDDPLLVKNYGFINFPKLLESARKYGYHVTLAFIPWNHWRSRAAKAQMFLSYSDCFSICAHGCDHTNNEFRSADYEDLLRRNFIASQRMEQHRERTGLVSEPLMVCPQEQYSLEAMRAFADSRQFIGLVCTACMPRNLASSQICGADLLLPAQDSFYGFPVFKRHYWSDISIFAMALFLGKPAILVEHHEFFRDGPAGAEAFVSELSKLRPHIKWTSLAETLTQTHLRRRLAEDRHEVRFFTDAFKLEHESKVPTKYRLLRKIPAKTIVRRVTMDGVETSFIRKDGLLTFEIRADRPQTFRIQVEVDPIKPAKAYGSSGIKYQASVALRRGLSEFRDNVVARNSFVLRAGKSLMKKLKQTSN